MSTHSATVIDLSAYRERRRAETASPSVPGHMPAPGFMGFVMVPTPYMMMWAPVWLAPPQAGPGHE